jgi:uncharacterized membrane protein YfcA
MPVGSLHLVRKNSYNLRAALGLTLAGPLAVFIAAFIVKSPLLYVRWLVVVVVVYTAATMLRSASKLDESRSGRGGSHTASLQRHFPDRGGLHALARRDYGRVRG